MPWRQIFSERRKEISPSRESFSTWNTASLQGEKLFLKNKNHFRLSEKPCLEGENRSCFSKIVFLKEEIHFLQSDNVLLKGKKRNCLGETHLLKKEKITLNVEELTRQRRIAPVFSVIFEL